MIPAVDSSSNPPYSSVKPSFRHCIDHIMYELVLRVLRVRRVLLLTPPPLYTGTRRASCSHWLC